MTVRLERLKLMVLVPDADTRSTLRDALASVVFKGDVRTLRRLEEAREILEREDGFHAIFFASSFGSQYLKDFILSLGNLKNPPDLALVLTVDRHTTNKLESVVNTYLSGVDGFISEPYTSEQLQELLLKVLDPKRERVVQSTIRIIKAVDLLSRDAVGLVDRMWLHRMEGATGSGAALGELKRISSSLGELFKSHPDEFASGLCSVFEAQKPPNPEVLKAKSSTRGKKAQHPGQIIKALMEQRGLTSERLLSLVRISQEEFDGILRGDLAVNEVFAREISRALGKTAREWISLQRAYDLTKPKV